MKFLSIGPGSWRSGDENAHLMPQRKNKGKLCWRKQRNKRLHTVSHWVLDNFMSWNAEDESSLGCRALALASANGDCDTVTRKSNNECIYDYDYYDGTYACHCRTIIVIIHDFSIRIKYSYCATTPSKSSPMNSICFDANQCSEHCRSHVCHNN